MNTTTRPPRRWLYAIKPASWPKLLVPMFLGQTLGICVSGGFSPTALLLGAIFTIADGIYIVLLNDWGDRDVDRIKRELFPDGCSPKTIPDGILPERVILTAGLLAGSIALGAALIAQATLGLSLAIGGAAACLLTFAAYTFPPLRLNYRGGGELLEAIGVGLLLPWFNAYLQSGQTWAPEYTLFAGFALASLASALASGLSDEVSDRQGGKTTFTTMFGNKATRYVAEALLASAPIAWLIAALSWQDAIHPIPIAAASLVLWWFGLKTYAESAAAKTNAFREQKRYKHQLHMAIWWSGATLGALCLIASLLV